MTGTTRCFFRAVLLFLLLSHAEGLAQSISYIIPDIGTPGMNTYVEIIGPHDVPGNFGSDGFHANNPGDVLRVECVNPDDSTKITIGPLVVSWNGRMIATQMFVHPDLRPNSDSWQGVAPEFVVPIRVRYNGNVQNTANFYIVRPQPAVITSSDGSLGSGGIWGLRSPRGAMIVDSLVLDGSSYGISTADCDPGAPGNQGFLPAVILSRGPVRLANNARLGVDANTKHGGPGGGGGGGNFCDWSGNGSDGGDGFTGGGAGGRNRAGNPLGSDQFRNPGFGSGDMVGGTGGSMNGVSGGNAPAYEASGGGTGHPFGQSGTGCGDGSRCDPPGGYGGGSGQQQQQAGGGGGYATSGSSSRSGNGGQVHGNAFVIPLAGGSGGASGNPQLAFSCSGDGGGGGGALRLFAPSLDGYLFTAIGGPGGDGASGDGGSGSGGAVSLESKLPSGIWKIRAEGGIGAGPRGGAGRIRMDGPMGWFSGGLPVEESMAFGPSTDTTQFVRRQFTLTGTGNGEDIVLMMRSDRMPWTEVATIGGYTDAWSHDITLPAGDNIYYLVAMQRVPDPASDAFGARPHFVLGQAAANILISRTMPELQTASSRMLRGIVCGDEESDTSIVENIGDGDLIISDARFIGARGFELVAPAAFPVTVAPGTALPIVVRFLRQPGQRGDVTDTLLIASNDPAPGPFPVVYSITVDEAELRASVITVDFADVVLCEGNTVDATFDLVNSGTVPLRVLPPEIGPDPAFSIISPAPGVWPLMLQPGAALPIQLRVSHAAAGSITASLRFMADDAGCNVETLLSLSARALAVEAEVGTIGAMAALRCFGESADTSFVIRNTGDLDIVVEEISSTDPAFIVLAPATPFRLSVAEERLVRLRFAPIAPGGYNGTIQVRLDRCGLRYERSITGVRDSVGLRLDAVDFGLQRAEMLPVTRAVRVINSGSVPVTITAATDMPPFRIVGGIPVNLPPGAGADLMVEFGDPSSDGTFSAAIPLLMLPSCDTPMLDVTGIRGTASVNLVVGTLAAAPGETVQLPLYLRNVNNMTLFGATAIRASLRFQASLLVPLGVPAGVLLGDERIMDITIPLATDAEGIALRVPLMATLGTSEESTIAISDVSPIGGDLTVSVTDGHFTLLDVCREGGTRLFDGGSHVQLRQNRPNPFNPGTEITFVLIERGHTQLRVFDAVGRLVATLADGWFEPGTHVRTFDGSHLPSGIYVAVLQTPTVVKERRMLLVK